jgi:hypothetical protein
LTGYLPLPDSNRESFLQDTLTRQMQLGWTGETVFLGEILWNLRTEQFL